MRLHGPERGPPVVLLHGFPLHGGMWVGQREALAGRWRLIVPDLRGHGASDVGDGQYAMDFLADDLFAVLEATTAKPVVGCGLSMGGYVLLRAWEREPVRFRALVLADTRSTADPDAGRLKRLDAVRALRREGLATYADAFVGTALGVTTRTERPAVVEVVKAMIRSNPVAGLVGAQLAMAARTDTTPALAGITVPTLVVVGGEDELTPPDVARELADHVPGARLVTIPRAGHLTPLESPAEFNAALVDFLTEAAPPA